MHVRPHSLVPPGTLLLAWAACGSFHGFAQELPVAAPPGVSKSQAVHLPPFRFMGAASCAAAACHNSGAPVGYRGREYGIAMERDPKDSRYRPRDRHASAYEVLFEKRSRQIEQKLRGLSDPKEAHPERNTTCLRCHVHPDATADASPIALQDGVSCEACHGSAERWLAAHFRAGWRERTASSRLAQGQCDTRSVLGRVRLCVDCHVGAPGMDVNHDLIAAGHPRLNFEFAGFHFLLHKHWDSAKDRNPATNPRGRTDFEAQAWMLGQVVSAQAALRLLADRADEKNGRVWPEFAEHDCVACHHDLKAESGGKKTKPGRIPQGRWYVTRLEQALAGLGSPVDGELKQALEAVRTGLEMSPANRKQLPADARQAVELLERRLHKAVSFSPDPRKLEPWFATMLASAGPQALETDDEAVQFFLARSALDRTRKDLHLPFGTRFSRPTLRLLLQLPGNDGLTIDTAVFRKALDGLKEAELR
jgi:hypothetical protein